MNAPPARRSTDRAIALVALGTSIGLWTLFADRIEVDGLLAAGYGLAALITSAGTAWLGVLAFRRWGRGR